jgi:hypothetical protein
MNVKAEIRERILSLASHSQVLIFGEVHGTQEVPALIRELLDDFQAIDFGILALELPHVEQDHLCKWALGEIAQPPTFFTHPFGDGRGNEQVLELIREATMKRWYLICFDDLRLVGGSWQQRDRAMAETLIEEWNENRPNKKVIAVCGNMHSRLSQTAGISEQFWPSFAAHVQCLQPAVRVKSVNVVFHQGEFFNIKVRKFHGRAIFEPYISQEERDGHSVTLHLPVATAATHLAKPPSVFWQFLRVAPTLVVNFAKRYKK